MLFVPFLIGLCILCPVLILFFLVGRAAIALGPVLSVFVIALLIFGPVLGTPFNHLNKESFPQAITFKSVEISYKFVAGRTVLPPGRITEATYRNKILVTLESTVRVDGDIYIGCVATNLANHDKFIMTQKVHLYGHPEFKATWMGFGNYEQIPETVNAVLLIPEYADETPDGSKHMYERYSAKCAVGPNSQVVKLLK